MNLYELAHHPKAWLDLPAQGDYWFGHKKYTTELQFDMLRKTTDPGAGDHTDESCFRMHLLFVYFATTPESE